MKTVTMTDDYNFRASRNVVIAFKAGTTYERVTEAQASAIVKAKAGKVQKKDDGE